MGNKQRNRHLHFPGQHYSFQGVFQTLPYLGSFSRLLKALKISTLNFRTYCTFQVCTGRAARRPGWVGSRNKMILTSRAGLAFQYNYTKNVYMKHAIIE